MLPCAAQLSKPVRNNRAISSKLEVKRLSLQGFCHTMESWNRCMQQKKNPTHVVRKKKEKKKLKVEGGNDLDCSGVVRRSHRRRQVSSAQTSNGAAGSDHTSRHGYCQGLLCLCSCIGEQVRVCAPGCVGNVCARVHVGERKGEREIERGRIQCSDEQLRADFGQM